MDITAIEFDSLAMAVSCIIVKYNVVLQKKCIQNSIKNKKMHWICEKEHLGPSGCSLPTIKR